MKSRFKSKQLKKTHRTLSELDFIDLCPASKCSMFETEGEAWNTVFHARSHGVITSQ